jgi:hypothetical protein
VKLNKFYNYNDIPEHIRKDLDPQYRFSRFPKVRSNWEINVPEIKDEPDFYAWKSNQLFCIIVRIIPYGNLNGYVIIPNNHPLYGDEGKSLYVHGGVTLSESISNWHGGDVNIHLFLSKLSHIINNDVWVFGFDTMHLGDALPDGEIENEYVTYRNFTYVLHEVTKLAEQVDELKDGSSDN